MPNNYLENLAQYLESCKHAPIPFHMVLVLHLADGVTAIRDSMNEYDVYFDVAKWEAVFPDVWEDDTLYPPRLKSLGLGVLPGLGRLPAVEDFENAASFAKQHLKPKDGVLQWHKPLPRVKKTL